MPYLRANFTCVTTIHCANFGSEPFLTTFSCYILSLLSLLYTVTSIPYDMEVTWLRGHCFAWQKRFLLLLFSYLPFYCCSYHSVITKVEAPTPPHRYPGLY